MKEMEEDKMWQPLLESALSVQKRRAMNRHYIELMRSVCREPLVVIPFLFTRNFGPEAIEALSERLAKQISPGSREAA